MREVAWVVFDEIHYMRDKGKHSRGNKCQLMVQSLLWEVAEPTIFIPEVAKQHGIFVHTIASKVLMSTHASFWLDEINWHLFPDWSKSQSFLTTVVSSEP